MENELKEFLSYIQGIMDRDVNQGRMYSTIGMEKGSKFIKLVQTSGGQNSSYGFIVIKEGKHGFPVGTILKSASWKAPALNFSRGSLMDKTSWDKCVKWTGIQ